MSVFWRFINDRWVLFSVIFFWSFCWRSFCRRNFLWSFLSSCSKVLGSGCILSWLTFSSWNLYSSSFFHCSLVTSVFFCLKFLSIFYSLLKIFHPPFNVQWINRVLVERTSVFYSIKVSVGHVPCSSGYKGTKLLINTTVPWEHHVSIDRNRGSSSSH